VAAFLCLSWKFDTGGIEGGLVCREYCSAHTVRRTELDVCSDSAVIGGGDKVLGTVSDGNLSVNVLVLRCDDTVNDVPCWRSAAPLVQSKW
jgi:hypothetical protein